MHDIAQMNDERGLQVFQQGRHVAAAIVCEGIHLPRRRQIAFFGACMRIGDDGEAEQRLVHVRPPENDGEMLCKSICSHSSPIDRRRSRV